MTPHDVTDQLIQSNLRGRGGAFFPTGRKASFIPTPDKVAKPIYLTVNADESEPGTFKDREIMLRVPHRLIEGCLIAAHAIQSKHVFIYIRGEYSTEYDVLAAALEEARAAGLLGDVELTIHRGAGAYICGEETALLESLEGKRGQPRSKPPFPAIQGLYASPTLINNVETITNVPKVLELGPAEYSQIGAPPDSTGTRVFCLSGNVVTAGRVRGAARHHRAPPDRGHRRRHRERADAEGRDGRRLVVPGDDAGRARHEARRRLARRSTGSSSARASITAIDDQACIVQFALRVAQFYMHESCGKCTPCRVGTRWLVQILRAVEDGSATENDLEVLLDVCDRIIGKCLCVLGDSAAMPVASCVTKFRDEFRAHLEHGGCPFGEDSTLAHLFAPVDQHAHTPVPAEVTP